MGLARRVGRATTIALVAGTVGGAVVIAAEAAVARTRRYARPDPNLAIRTSHGDPKAQVTRLVLLGDSSALGVRKHYTNVCPVVSAALWPAIEVTQPVVQIFDGYSGDWATPKVYAECR